MTSDSDSRPATPGPAADHAASTDRVFAAFGGIRPMAHKLGMPVTTVQGWKKRGAIPHQRHDAIRAAAREHGIALDDTALAASAAPDLPPDTPEQPVRPPPQPKARTTTPPRTPADEPPKPPARPRRQRPVLAWSALAVALVSLALVVTVPLWTGPVYRLVGLPVASGTSAVDLDLARLDRLEDQLAELQRQAQTLATDGGEGAGDGAMTAQLQAMDRRLAALEKIATPALADRVASIGGAVDALAADIARMDGVLGNQRIALSEARGILTNLETRADAVETRLEEIVATQQRDGRRIERLIASDSGSQALVLAIGQLRVAMNAGRPYAQPLMALHGLAAGIDETVDDLAVLAPHAAAGIPDRDALKTGFPIMAQAVRDAVLLPADAGLVEQVMAKIKALVTVRPAPGEVDGDDVGAVLARAEGRLINRDLPGAVAAVGLLDGDAAAAAAQWRRSAEARLAAELALENLINFAIDRLANTAPDEPTP